MGLNGSKSGQSGSRWVQFGSKGPNGFKWILTGKIGTKWVLMGPNGYKWAQEGSKRSKRVHWVKKIPNWFKRAYIVRKNVQLGTKWVQDG